MAALLDRITVNPRRCGGRPCIRETRMRVLDVLELYESGMNSEQILDEFPDLEADDLKACLAYARARLEPLATPSQKAA